MSPALEPLPSGSRTGEKTFFSAGFVARTGVATAFPALGVAVFRTSRAGDEAETTPILARARAGEEVAALDIDAGLTLALIFFCEMVNSVSYTA